MQRGMEPMKGVLSYALVSRSTCQNGFHFGMWGDVTATAKTERTLKVILTHRRQLCRQRCDKERLHWKGYLSKDLVCLGVWECCLQVMSECFFYLDTGVRSPERCRAGDVRGRVAEYRSRRRTRSPGWTAASREYSWICGGNAQQSNKRFVNNQKVLSSVQLVYF